MAGTARDRHLVLLWVGLAALAMAGCGGGTSKATSATSSTTQAPSSTTVAVSTTTAPGTTAPASATSATAQRLGTLLVEPPGFLPSTSTDVTNGPIGPAALDTMVGQPGAAVSFGFLGGYDETYDMTSGNDSVEVFLAQFTTTANAAAFEQVLIQARSGTGVARSTFGAIAGAVALDDTQAADDGTYEHDVTATKGARLMGVSYIASSSVPVPQVGSIAVTQYRRL